MPPLTVSYLTVKLIIPLAGPDLQMGGGGGGGAKEKFFRPFGPQFVLK